MNQNKEKSELYNVMYEWWASFGKYKRCMACGKLLPKEFSTVNVDHLLEWKKWPQYKFYTPFFFLVCINCHDMKSSGFPLSKHKEAINKAKEKHLKGEARQKKLENHR